MDAARLAALSNRGARRRSVSVPMAKLHAGLYRATKGRLGHGWFGAPVLVLEVRGRRSGETRRIPILYAQVDGTPVVVAANAGADRHPAWWLNLRAAGEATVDVRGARSRVRPRELHGAERDRAWTALVAAYPAADHYGAYTDRRFPVVALEEDA